MKNFVRLLSIVLLFSIMLCGCSEAADAKKPGHDVCMEIISDYTDAVKNSDIEAAASLFSPHYISFLAGEMNSTEESARYDQLATSFVLAGNIKDFTISMEAEVDSEASDNSIVFFDNALKKEITDSYPGGVESYYENKFSFYKSEYTYLEVNGGYKPEKLLVINGILNLENESSIYGDSVIMNFVFEFYEGSWNLFSVDISQDNYT